MTITRDNYPILEQRINDASIFINCLTQHYPILAQSPSTLIRGGGGE